ncbi:MAG: hypothetical protein JWQ35_2330 [Bacteriovoracaceae bacterium]|nr:hypothetical protein [Bacteriovoracaceae bacterium]
MKSIACHCKKEIHSCKLIVVTGGPGAGKTAVLDAAKKMLCQHIGVLPESASIIYNGGFWRKESLIARKAAQRAIFSVQRELEIITLNEGEWSIGLCDRGSLDGLAYWPGTDEELFSHFQTSLSKEFDRYAAVIHLCTPSLHEGYNHQNPVRIESATEAIRIDEKIAQIWKGHPNFVSIPSTHHFTEKLNIALRLIKKEIAECCADLV